MLTASGALGVDEEALAAGDARPLAGIRLVATVIAYETLGGRARKALGGAGCALCSGISGAAEARLRNCTQHNIAE